MIRDIDEDHFILRRHGGDKDAVSRRQAAQRRHVGMLRIFQVRRELVIRLQDRRVFAGAERRLLDRVPELLPETA